MFNGSKTYDGEWFLQEAGGTDLSTTWFDRTNYFQNARSALDAGVVDGVDRMEHFINAVTQDTSMSGVT